MLDARTMHVRELDVSRLAELRPMAEHFFRTKLAHKLNDCGVFHWDILAKQFIAAHAAGVAHGLVLEDDKDTYHGLITFVVSFDAMAGGMVAAEWSWCVEPEVKNGGERLLREFVKRAASLGAKVAMVGVFTGHHSDGMARLYKRHGFRELQRQYVCELTLAEM